MVIMFIGEEVEFNSVMKLLSYRSGGGNKGAKSALCSLRIPPLKIITMAAY